MSRVPSATRESIPENQRPAFDEIVQQRGGIPESGPGSVTINVPEIARRMNHLSDYLRGESTLSSKTQELAMLVTARELDCLYVWNAHAAAGRKAGLKDETVDNLRDKKELTGLGPEEAAVINYGQEFFRTRRVSQKSFQKVIAQFGVRGATELTNLMGYYAMLAFNVNAFEVDPPSDSPEQWLPV